MSAIHSHHCNCLHPLKLLLSHPSFSHLRVADHERPLHCHHEAVVRVKEGRKVPRGQTFLAQVNYSLLNPKIFHLDKRIATPASVTNVVTCSR
jgi:hypothetical protein